MTGNRIPPLSRASWAAGAKAIGNAIPVLRDKGFADLAEEMEARRAECQRRANPEASTKEQSK